MRINDAGLDIIKASEEFYPIAKMSKEYNVVIGYGSRRGLSHSDLGKKRVTVEEATELLREDLVRYEGDIERMITVPLTENQFSALVVYIREVTAGTFATSVVRMMVNDSDFVGVRERFDTDAKGEDSELLDRVAFLFAKEDPKPEVVAPVAVAAKPAAKPRAKAAPKPKKV